PQTTAARLATSSPSTVMGSMTTLLALTRRSHRELFGLRGSKGGFPTGNTRWMERFCRINSRYVLRMVKRDWNRGGGTVIPFRALVARRSTMNGFADVSGDEVGDNRWTVHTSATSGTMTSGNALSMSSMRAVLEIASEARLNRAWRR